MPRDHLSDAKVRSAKPGPKAYKLYDGGGLFLLVQPNGSRYWRLKYRTAGKEKLFAVGVYPEVGLSEARAKALEAKGLIRDGADPVVERRRHRASQATTSAETFQAIAEEWIASRADIWAATYREATHSALAANLYPHIGALPIPAAVIPALAWSGVIGFGGLALTMVLVYAYQAPVRRWLERHLARVSPKLAQWAERTTGSVVGGFAFVRELDTTPRFALLTLIYWAMNVFAFWLLLWGAGVPSPTLLQAGVVQGVMGLGMVVPNAPGYFGTFQISAYAALVLFYPLAVVTQAGAAFVFLLYVIQMLLTLGAGAVALFWGLKPVAPASVPTASVEQR